jgi:hypothetical protein
MRLTKASAFLHVFFHLVHVLFAMMHRMFFQSSFLSLGQPTFFKVSTHYLFLLFTDLTLRGAPAGCPKLFFSLTFLAFSALDISPDVLGVLEDTRLLGRQYGVPRPSPFFLPQGLPVLTSFQSSLNQRFSAAPFSVFRMPPPDL